MSGARRERIMGVWHDVALSEGNSLGHKETGLCVFSKIWYGGSWGPMRNAHKIWGRSKVFLGVIGGFEKMQRIGGYRQNFQLEWPSVWLSDWAEIWCRKVSKLEEHAHNISRDLHE